MALTFLVEIGCLIAGVQSTLRYSWAARPDGYQTRPSDTPANEPYAPRLTGCTFRYDAKDDTVRLGSGQIALENTDGALDDLLGYVYDSQTAKLLVVDENAAYTAAKEIARWTLEQPSDGNQRIALVTRTPVYKLDAPIQTAIYGGTGGVDGTSDLANKPKPLPFGMVHAKAVLVDPVKLIYQLASGHDLTAVGLALGFGVLNASNLSVYDEGLAATRGATDYTNVADMLANAPTGADDYRVCNAIASGSTYNYGVYVRFQSSPAGEVTFTGLFRPHCNAVPTATALTNLVYAASGMSSGIYTTDLNFGVLLEFPYNTLFYFGSDGESATYMDALREILIGMRGWMVPYQGAPTQYPADGLLPPWAVRWLDTPATATASPYKNDLLDVSHTITPYLTIDGSQIMSPLVRGAAYDLGWPEFRTTLLVERYHYLQTTGLAGGVSVADRARLALEFLSKSATDLSVKTAFPTAVDRAIRTAWGTAVTGSLADEASRQLDVLSEHHPTFEVGARVDLYHGALTVPGDPMAIVNYAHHDCDVSRTFLILGMELDYLAFDEGAQTIGFSGTLWG